MDIADWRKRIDEIDEKLTELLSERSHCVIEIGKIKRQCGLPIYDPEREKDIVARVTRNNRGPMENEALIRLFERILDESRRVERLMAGEHRSDKGAKQS
jgi:chorismate mutase-like protein